MIQFRSRGKLNPGYIGPFVIVERVGLVTYSLELPPKLEKIYNVFHVSMQKRNVPDPSHTLEASLVELREHLSFEVQPVKILDQQVKTLRRKVIPMVKVLLRSDLVQKVTWEPEKLLKRSQPLLIQDQGKPKISRTKFL